MAETKTSRLSWQKSLREACKLQSSSPNPRTIVFGIGQELRGDDALGGLVVQGLKVSLADNPNWAVLEGGTAPENATGVMRRENPGLVIMVDAANMGEPPGTIRFFESNLLQGFSGSTHTLPLSVLASYLEAELDCRVVLLGVQAESLEFGGDVSQSVQQVIQEIIHFLVELSHM